MRVVVAGERALVSLAVTGQLAILALESGALLDTVPVGPLPDGIAVAGAGHAFVALAGSDHIVVVDIERGRVVGELPAGEGPSGLLWTEAD